jgi:hypothetical protein
MNIHKSSSIIQQFFPQAVKQISRRALAAQQRSQQQW